MNVTELYARDGGECFYCGINLVLENATSEHVLAKTHGGNDNQHNLVLACQPCNVEADARSIIDKVKLRELKRGVGSGIEVISRPAKVKINGVLIEVLQ